jgi:hypothetical protein
MPTWRDFGVSTDLQSTYTEIWWASHNLRAFGGTALAKQDKARGFRTSLVKLPQPQPATSASNPLSC